MKRGEKHPFCTQRTSNSGSGTGPKNPHVVARIEHAGKAHRKPHADVPAQHVPAGRVVARPGLRVPLYARRPGTRDGIHPFVRPMRRLGLVGGAGHQQRVQRPRALDRKRRAEAMRGAEVVPDLEFVVVVPAGIDAVIEHLTRQAVLPPADAVGMREVDMRALAVPELADAGPACARVAHERLARCDFGVSRVVVEQTGFQVDDRANVLLPELVDRRARLRELVAIPGEDVAALADAACNRNRNGTRTAVRRVPRPCWRNR